jgi:hypothetical protein
MRVWAAGPPIPFFFFTPCELVRGAHPTFAEQNLLFKVKTVLAA